MQRVCFIYYRLERDVRYAIGHTTCTIAEAMAEAYRIDVHARYVSHARAAAEYSLCTVRLVRYEILADSVRHKV